MSDLVQALKAEHVNIGKILAKTSELGIHSEEGRKALTAAKTALLAHLQREDEHLYPILWNAASDDPILHDALDFFSKDIAGVGEAAIAFFEKHETGTMIDDFAHDLSELMGILVQRIQKEESVIYKMFDQLDFSQNVAPA
jgi:hypothetical protein